MAVPSKPSQCLKFLCPICTQLKESPLQRAALILSLLHLSLELKSFSGFPTKSSSKILAWHLRPIILTQFYFLGLSPLPF